jgi:hypothetical protein
MAYFVVNSLESIFIACGSCLFGGCIYSLDGESYGCNPAMNAHY